MRKIAIVGAGPGGLMTARLLEQRCGTGYSATVFEASPRIGGKLHTRKSCGVLGWLIAGANALMLCNADDATLTELALSSLPDGLEAIARRSPRECRVHRWAGAVSARPGRPAPDDAEGLLLLDRTAPGALWVVGDYLFDATLNGVLRSATRVADLIAAEQSSFT